MAPGRKTLRKFQIGPEVTPGTQVAATAILRGFTGGGIEDTRVIKRINEYVGILGKDGSTDRSVVTRYGSTIGLEGVASFEQLQYFIAMSLGGPVTGVQDGAGTLYIYTTNVAETTLPTITTYTVEAGDDAEALEFGYAYCPEWKLSGAGGEALMLSATLNGQETTTATFTGALTLSAMEDILVSKGKVYIDAVSGSYGGTQVVGQVLAIDVTCSPVIVEKPTLDGSLDFTYAYYTGHEFSGSITFEHDTAALLATSGGVHNAFASQTAKKLQLKFEGSSGTGTTYSAKTLILNLPIKWTKVSTLDDQDGNDIIVADFVSAYNETAADSGSIIVVNKVAALP